MIEIQDVVLHMASAGGGGAGVAWLARLLIKGWLKTHDKMEATLEAAVLLLTRIDERVTALQQVHGLIIDHDRQIAIIQADIANSKDDKGHHPKIRN